MRHLVDNAPVSDFCDEFGLQPTQVYAWQRQRWISNRRGSRSSMSDAKDRKIVALEAKVQQKIEVVTELLQKHVQLKKELGEL